MKRRRSSSKQAKSNKRAKVNEQSASNELEPDWSLMLPEILLRIFGHLDYYSLRKSAAVCRFWMQCANDESLAVMHLLDTECTYTKEGEDTANYVKKSIRVLRDTGEYEAEPFKVDFLESQNYLMEDYIEIRSEIGKDFDRWQVFLRYHKVEELLKHGKRIDTKCWRRIRKITHRALSRNYETVFLESSITKSVSSKLKSKLAELKLTDHQLEAISWMLSTEKNKAQIKIHPVVPVPNSPLLLKYPGNDLILPNEVPNTEKSFESSNRIIFATSLKCAALEVIGLMLASNKRERTLIVTETTSRAKIWRQYLAAAPALKVIEVDPEEFQHLALAPNVPEYVYMMVSLADLNKNEINCSKTAPYARIVYDNLNELKRLNGDHTAFAWCIRVVAHSSPRLSSYDPLVSNLFHAKTAFSLYASLQDDNTDDSAYKYLRHVKLVPELFRKCVWINQGIKLKIQTKSS